MEQKPIHVDIKFAIDSLRKELELSKETKKYNIVNMAFEFICNLYLDCEQLKKQKFDFKITYIQLPSGIIQNVNNMTKKLTNFLQNHNARVLFSQLKHIVSDGNSDFQKELLMSINNGKDLYGCLIECCANQNQLDPYHKNFARNHNPSET